MKILRLNIILIVIIIWNNGLNQASAQSGIDPDFIKARSYMDSSEWDSALHYINKVSDNARSRDVYLEKGKIYYFKAEYQNAIAEFNRAEEIEKGKASFWIAKSYAKLNDLNNCLSSLKVNLTSKYKLAESEIMLDEDFQDFEKDPQWLEFWREGNWYTNFDIMMAEADFLIKSRNYPDAINLLSESLTKGFRKAPIYERRAKVYYELKNYNLALSDLNNAIFNGGNNPDLFHQRARINYISGNYKQSLDDYNSTIKLDPAEMELYQERAMALNKNGNYEAAIKDMSYYLTYYSRNDSAWFNFGLIHSDNKNYVEALSCFNKSLALNTSDPRYFAARGMAYLNTRTFRYAWRDFSMSLDLDPGNSEVYLNKGIAAINLGDKKDACFCFETSKKLGNIKAIDFADKYCK